MTAATWTVEISDQPCHVCGSPLLLSLRLPHPGFAPDLAGVYTRIVSLCANCDRKTEAAQGLLAFFVVHADVDEGNVREFGALLRQWMDRLPDPPRLDPQAVEAEWEAWRSGEFD